MTSWNPEQYPESLKEVMAMHSLLFTLGYSLSEEVFVVLTPDSVLVELKAEGRKATFRVGVTEYKPEVLMKKYREMMKEWNTGGSATQADKDALCAASKTWRNVAVIRTTLLKLEFRRQPRDAGPWPFSMN